MSGQDDERIGTRIAAQRKRAGLTQHGLGQLIPYSYSLLRHVEAGNRSASPELVAAVARALRINAATLTGPSVPALTTERITALLRPVRESLDLFDLPADPHVRPRPGEQLITDAEALCRTVRAAQLQQAGASLPGLLAELTAMCRESPSSDHWRALASTYRSAHDVTTKFGRYDLATLSLDRMGWAADRAGDPVLGAIRQYKRALGYCSREAQHRVGLSMTTEGRRMLEQTDDGVEALATAGQLHLGAAIVAAQAEDRVNAEGHLAQAQEIAVRTGEVGHVHWLSFGPANVATHTVYARLALRDYDGAYTAARKVRMPRTWATSRRAGHLVDRARAETETGRTEAALQSLVRARELAPQQTRFHPQARETVQALLHMRRQSPDQLTRMATWVGV